MIDRREFSTTVCGYVDKSKKLSTTSAGGLPHQARYFGR